MESVSTGPTPALFTLRSLPSFALAFGSRSGPHCPSTFGASAPPSQPASPIPRSHPDPPAAPLRDHPPAHTRPPAPALTHAHTHTSTPPRTHPHHTHTLSRHAPGRPHMPALLRCTHSNSNSEDSGICRRVDLRPMSYGSKEVLPVWAGQGVGSSGRSGEIGAGASRGPVGPGLGVLSDQRKKMQKTVHFSLENFAK